MIMGKYTGTYRGKVLSTDVNEVDSAGAAVNLGRIKCEVYPMLIGITTAQDLDGVNGIETALLPWAVPAMPLFSGAGVGYGSFSVPEVGSFVWVFFEGGDVYQPVYFAEAATKTHGLPSERATDYPYTKVWRTARGIVITINDLEGSEDIKVLHPTGTNFQIDSSGNVIIDSKGTTTIISTGNLSITAPRVDLN